MRKVPILITLIARSRRDSLYKVALEAANAHFYRSFSTVRRLGVFFSRVSRIELTASGDGSGRSRRPYRPIREITIAKTRNKASFLRGFRERAGITARRGLTAAYVGLLIGRGVR
ncbi:hypothetical protein EVAR_17559_1 [Eumeta japonica]|uniref:Uncharacterized protein n=1 Tax=Eumeta variegata TaxID=151549 RepID=A0A4C1UD79_EUMVA|nr:hypothetical protein EVAR_17559_1 [Eumeta japonica]